MGFTFGFTEDIEDDLNNKLEFEKKDNNKEFINPIDNAKILQDPKLYSLEELLQLSFTDTRMTYEPVKIDEEMILFRRELFDVRHQLMMEDNNIEQENKEEFNILIGETGEDLKNGIYEGGLKSWECSFDMISKLKEINNINKLLKDNNEKFNVIELGCGTSLPTLYILKLIFCHFNEKEYKEQEQAHVQQEAISIVLSDYNFDVLRLVTLPNILLNWCATVLTQEELNELQQREGIDGNIRDGEIDITKPLVNKFIEWLKMRNISIKFICGSWCRKFMNLLYDAVPCMSQESNTIMTSETIYSLEILPVISEIMVELASKNHGGQEGVTLLSAKDIYFGVGGSIVECQRYLLSRGARVCTTSAAGSFKRSVLSIAV